MRFFGVWLISPLADCPPDGLTYLDEPPYELSPHGFTTQQIDPGGQTVLVTERPPRDGIKRAPTGSKSKRLTPCAIHACELDYSRRRQSKRLGRRP